MSEPFFFERSFDLSFFEIAEIGGAQVCAQDRDRRAQGVAALENAEAADVTFYDNPKYAHSLPGLKAGACFVRAKNLNLLPPATVGLTTPNPALSMARLLQFCAPSSLRAPNLFGPGIAFGAVIHPQARLEPDVEIDAGAIIGARAEIGSGARIGAHATIGAGVRIGRNCVIGPGCSLTYALLGDRVILHPGVRVGQDGFGFARGARGLEKAPQIGRVIIQDDVEIGANSTIDRGSLRDTLIGEGTKIDNLVQIAHNVTIGRHCVIVAQTGIAGSTRLEDYVMVGGQAAIAGHLRIGAGARIAAQSGVMRDVAPGARVGGSPAQNLTRFLKAAAHARKKKG